MSGGGVAIIGGVKGRRTRPGSGPRGRPARGSAGGGEGAEDFRASPDLRKSGAPTNEGVETRRRPVLKPPPAPADDRLWSMSRAESGLPVPAPLARIRRPSPTRDLSARWTPTTRAPEPGSVPKSVPRGDRAGDAVPGRSDPMSRRKKSLALMAALAASGGCAAGRSAQQPRPQALADQAAPAVAGGGQGRGMAQPQRGDGHEPPGQPVGLGPDLADRGGAGGDLVFERDHNFRFMVKSGLSSKSEADIGSERRGVLVLGQRQEGPAGLRVPI